MVSFRKWFWSPHLTRIDRRFAFLKFEGILSGEELVYNGTTCFVPKFRSTIPLKTSLTHLFINFARNVSEIHTKTQLEIQAGFHLYLHCHLLGTVSNFLPDVYTTTYMLFEQHLPKVKIFTMTRSGENSIYCLTVITLLSPDNYFVPIFEL